MNVVISVASWVGFKDSVKAAKFLSAKLILFLRAVLTRLNVIINAGKKASNFAAQGIYSHFLENIILTSQDRSLKSYFICSLPGKTFYLRLRKIRWFQKVSFSFSLFFPSSLLVPKLNNKNNQLNTFTFNELDDYGLFFLIMGLICIFSMAFRFIKKKWEKCRGWLPFT